MTPPPVGTTESPPGTPEREPGTEARGEHPASQAGARGFDSLPFHLDALAQVAERPPLEREVTGSSPVRIAATARLPSLIGPGGRGVRST